MKRFINDTKKYARYSVYSARSELKAEVANSYLNWLWWILDPLCFMGIYYCIFGIVFQSKEEYFLVFIFVGITMWDFFSRTIKSSVKMIKSNKSIVSKIYLPKFVLLYSKMMVNGFKMAVSFIIVIILMIVQQVPVSVNILYVIPLMLTLIIFTFGCSAYIMHFGVYVEDLTNIVNIVLRLLFYVTGIFYNIENRIGGFYGDILTRYNPMAYLLSSVRNSLIYCSPPHRKLLLFWFVISVLIAASSIRKIYKNENSYVKVI